MQGEIKNIILTTNLSFYKSSSDKPHILFLHGFTGSSADWKEIIPKIDDGFSKISMDLIGHGNSPSPDDISYFTPESISEQIDKTLIIHNIEKVIVIGYSMGGRAALNYTFSFPGKVTGLCLESTTAGIESSSEREKRKESDNKLAQSIFKEGLERFIDYWMNIPLFSSQKKLDEQKIDNIRKQKTNNTPNGLVNSLLGFGTGEMPSYWNRLNELNVPVLLISGELDDKYCEINKRMDKLIYKSNHTIIPEAGHNTHLEKPSEFVILVNEFLRTYFN